MDIVAKLIAQLKGQTQACPVDGRLFKPKTVNGQQKVYCRRYCQQLAKSRRAEARKRDQKRLATGNWFLPANWVENWP